MAAEASLLMVEAESSIKLTAISQEGGGPGGNRRLGHQISEDSTTRAFPDQGSARVWLVMIGHPELVWAINVPHKGAK